MQNFEVGAPGVVLTRVTVPQVDDNLSHKVEILFHLLLPDLFVIDCKFAGAHAICKKM